MCWLRRDWIRVARDGRRLMSIAGRVRTDEKPAQEKPPAIGETAEAPVRDIESPGKFATEKRETLKRAQNGTLWHRMPRPLKWP